MLFFFYNNKNFQSEVLKALTECKLLNTKVEIYSVPILERFFKKYKIIIIDKNFISNNHIIYINNEDNLKMKFIFSLMKRVSILLNRLQVI